MQHEVLFVEVGQVESVSLEVEDHLRDPLQDVDQLGFIEGELELGALDSVVLEIELPIFRHDQLAVLVVVLEFRKVMADLLSLDGLEEFQVLLEVSEILVLFEFDQLVMLVGDMNGDGVEGK